jgi:hypothetical protein
MKTSKLVLIALAIAALTASSAIARPAIVQRSPMPRTASNTAFTHRGGGHWGHHHRHFWPRPNIYFGFGYPFGYPYGYGYYGGPRTVVYETIPANGSIVVAVQRRLAQTGYYRGTIDGVIGNETRRAIRAYERGHGLPVDGRLDQQLLATMGIA